MTIWISLKNFLLFSYEPFWNGQIDLNYNGKSPCPEVVFPVDEEGKINALVGCGHKRSVV